MRKQSDAKEDFTASIVCKAYWRVVQVEPLDNYCLKIKFNDGLEGIVDMSQKIMSDKAGVFAELCNKDFFNKVYILLGVVSWPGGLDIAPDAMYENIKQQGKWILN